MILVPYHTDAPVYCRPVGTVALIGTCVAFAFLFGFPTGGDGLVDNMMLGHGHFEPWTWITSNFVHEDWFHLGVNVIFLWAFGLVVEGAAGTRKFLLIALSIGIAQCAIEQLLYLGGDPVSTCGISAIVIGLLAIAAVWAPRNHFRTFYWIFLVFVGIREFRILTIAVIYIGLDLLGVLLTGFAMSSSLWHLMGAVVGLAIGSWMALEGHVDTENEDWFALRRQAQQKAADYARRRSTWQV